MFCSNILIVNLELNSNRNLVDKVIKVGEECGDPIFSEVEVLFDTHAS